MNFFWKIKHPLINYPHHRNFWKNSTMIINTGMRTDIPAFFSRWLIDKIRKGEVCVRNPYNQHQITRFQLDPEIVDCMIFCTKNPRPLLNSLFHFSRFRQLWHITVTPYGPEIEPLVPPSSDVIDSIRNLAGTADPFRISWRYDPIFITGRYSENFHYEAFEYFSRQLSGYAENAIISFIKLYSNTLRNHKYLFEVPQETKSSMVKRLSAIAEKYRLNLIVCGAEPGLQQCGEKRKVCIDRNYLEKIIGSQIDIPSSYKGARDDCSCILGSDIGAYNTCIHGCTYCYANHDHEKAKRNFRTHNPESPLLFGEIGQEDQVTDASQKSWISRQLSMFD